MCERTAAIVALIACNVYCERNPNCQVNEPQNIEDIDIQYQKITTIEFCSNKFEAEKASCMQDMSFFN